VPRGQGRVPVLDRGPHAPRSRCFDCTVYHTLRGVLERPHELSVGERAITAVSSFIELRETNDLWEVLVFHDAAAEKVDAALKVAGAAAHELRQPLQTVVMLAGPLKKDLAGNDRGQSLLEKLHESCGRMDGIIRQMTEIMRYETKEYVQGSTILDIDHSSGRKITSGADREQ
jgi:signal transduction histidine kinase